MNTMPFPANCDMENFASNCLKQNIQISRVDNLRQRDFSVVARIHFHLPCGSNVPSLIYKKVRAPWHCEAQIMRFVKDAQLPNVPHLIGAKISGDLAETLQEDAGSLSLCDYNSDELAMITGLALAQTHDRALESNKCYPQIFARLDSGEKIAECFQANASKLGGLYPDFNQNILANLAAVGSEVAEQLESLECCLQHGDLYGENIVLKDGNSPVFIDWSYFCFIGPRIYDLATLASSHSKNGSLVQHRKALLAGYSAGSEFSVEQIENLLPSAFRLSRLLFLQWLLTRVQMGITETTVGPVRPLIDTVVSEILN